MAGERKARATELDLLRTSFSEVVPIDIAFRIELLGYFCFCFSCYRGPRAVQPRPSDEGLVTPAAVASRTQLCGVAGGVY